MDLLDRLLRHDVWTTLQLLAIARELSDEQLDREFDIGHRTLRATFEHTIYNVEAWTDEMSHQPIRPRGGKSVPELESRLSAAASDLAVISRQIADRDAWDETWIDPITGKSRTYGATIAHVVTHSMHHRAQILYLLRLLNVEDLPEGDLLSWEERAERR